MAWKKGRSGNPGGKPREKPFLDALKVALSAPDLDGTPKLRRIAEGLVNAAIDGEAWAIQQVADRLDGKPLQEAAVSIDDKRSFADWTDAELLAVIEGARGVGGPDDSGQVH